MMSKFIKRMAAQDYIDTSRKYLDYIEEHLNNVSKAFDELSSACEGKEYWVGDDYTWHSIKEDVTRHDISKLSMYEFVQYRDYFFPVTMKDKTNSGFELAWEHHKSNNYHHHETVDTYNDICHMVIDWIAMSYKFQSDPSEYYEKTKNNMNLNEWQETEIEKLLNHLKSHRRK